MIINESTKIFDKNIVSFFLLLLRIDQHVFLHKFCLIHRLGVFLLFLYPKTLMSVEFFFNTKPNVATNLKPFNWVNKSISLLLIADSVSLSCSSGLKEFKISTL